MLYPVTALVVVEPTPLFVSGGLYYIIYSIRPLYNAGVQAHDDQDVKTAVAEVTDRCAGPLL